MAPAPDTAAPPGQRVVQVHAPGRSYEVVVGQGLLARFASLFSRAGLAVGNGRVFLAHDAALPRHVAMEVADSLRGGGAQVSIAAVQADEKSKTLAGMETLLRAIARTRHERGEPIVALGGGIVGDIAGFAAAIYRRGVPVIQCPTTLLGMVDAAVGGKTAVNLAVDDGLMKNLIGAFHQPRLVVADVGVLRSLSPRQMRCGLAECIKHGMIGAEFGEPQLLDWIETHLEAIAAHDPGTLIELIARNVAVKAAVIAIDEREEVEGGGRALLNLGHTFAHAIETVPEAVPVFGDSGDPQRGTGAAGLHHGEAVALGLIAAATCAEAAGVCPVAAGIAERVRRVVERGGLPVQARGLPDPESLLARMSHDKKVKGGVLRLVLPCAPGRAALVPDPPRAAVLAGWEAIGAG